MLSLLKFIPFSLKTALIAFLTGCFVSWYVAHAFAEKDAAERLRIALEQKNREIEAVIAESQALRELDAIAMERIVAEKTKQKTREIVITKEIPKYVPVEVDGGCNFSLGAVGLLNIARSQSGAASVSEATGLSDEILRTPSDHTPQAEIESHAQCIERYNALSAEHNALIDFLNHRDSQ